MYHSPFTTNISIPKLRRRKVQIVHIIAFSLRSISSNGGLSFGFGAQHRFSKATNADLDALSRTDNGAPAASSAATAAAEALAAAEAAAGGVINVAVGEVAGACVCVGMGGMGGRCFLWTTAVAICIGCKPGYGVCRE